MDKIEEMAKAYAMGRAYAQGLKHRYAMAKGKVLKNWGHDYEHESTWHRSGCYSD